MNNFKMTEIEQFFNAPDYDDDNLINSEFFGVIYSLGRDAENDEEYRYALNLLLSLCDRKSQRVRTRAIIAISLLAIKHKRLERERVEPIIIREWEIADDENKATIRDAIDDINNAMKWNMAV